MPEPQLRCSTVLGFKVQRHSESIGNVWYRAFYPALQLSRDGHDVRVFENTPSPALIASLDALIIVKPTNLTDLKVAFLAHEAGTPVIVDLCDDIFVPSYGRGRGVERAICTAVLNIASVAVTTGPILAAKVRKMVHHNVPVVEIPDPVESESENAAIRRSFRATLRRAELRRIFGKCRRYISSLKKFLISALPQVIRRTLPKVRIILQYGWHARHTLVTRQPPKFLSEQVFFKPTVVADQALDKSRAQLDQDLHLPPAAGLPLGRSRKRIIWFGNAGAGHGDFGLPNLNLIKEPLARVAAVIPLELIVVSNNRTEFERITKAWPFPCIYRPWSRKTIFRELDQADLCVIPNSRDPFSLAKSANRHALALSRGIPVVATSIPAAQALKEFMVFDDWEKGILNYLTDEARAKQDALAGQEYVLKHFGPSVMGAAWERVLSGLEKRHDRVVQTTEAVRVLAFMDLVQDLDVLMPVMQGLMRDPRFDLKVCVTEWLVSESPRVLQQLTSNGIVPILVNQEDVLKGAAPHLCFDAVLTAVESNNPAHRVSFSLTKRAEALGQKCFTFQHGLENIGLTYFAAHPEGPDGVQFASSHIFIWGKAEDLPAQVAPDIRARCVAVGRPISAPLVLPSLPMRDMYRIVVGVFENLHWQRYSSAYTELFLKDLFAAVTAHRDVLFLIKPHHAGRWTSEHLAALKASPPNLVLASPTDPLWEPFTASAILQIVDGAITTPSTVALDAALAGKPVAVAAYGLSLPTYSPLPLLQNVKDWNEFIASCETGKNEIISRSLAFRDRSALSGDAIPRILQSIFSRTKGQNCDHENIIDRRASDGNADEPH
ncbi:MAG: hypothetical protein INF96_12070 [Roseomonas sp.]|nr:hypothetical protein [Roseomonas sp.]MCA3374182.1 hypothetical protein [Roseomonas sp.]MCA3397691.1 hypothetical protein [Roseomonas sp.]MCA3399411.1 hypothetical protein [Roseomonas sp.]MCA3404671.1 hypothetical protein [Roseomonas sp.]